jgi:hypothetical protein
MTLQRRAQVEHYASIARHQGRLYDSARSGKSSEALSVVQASSRTLAQATLLVARLAWRVF